MFLQGIYSIYLEKTGMFEWEFVITQVVFVPHRMRPFVYYFCLKSADEMFTEMSGQFSTIGNVLHIGNSSFLLTSTA